MELNCIVPMQSHTCLDILGWRPTACPRPVELASKTSVRRDAIRTHAKDIVGLLQIVTRTEIDCLRVSRSEPFHVLMGLSNIATQARRQSQPRRRKITTWDTSYSESVLPNSKVGQSGVF